MTCRSDLDPKNETKLNANCQSSSAVPEIIDAHIHLSERRNDRLNAYAERNGLRYNLDELLRLMKESGVTLGLLLSSISEKGDPFPYDDVLSICERSQGGLLPVATVASSSEGVSNALQLARRGDSVVKAFKIMLGYGKTRADNPVFNRLYDYAESNDIPVMFHTGDTALENGSLTDAHPLTLDALANKREGLRIIACHFGSPWFDDVAELVYKHRNFYADISGLAVGGSRYIKEYTEWLAQRLSNAIYYAGGADKIIFGSDYPVTKPSSVVSLVQRLGIDTQDRRKILSENAKKVFRL